MDNPLDSVMTWYHTVRDCTRVTSRILIQGIPDAVTNRHLFFKKSQAESTNLIESAKSELDRLVILALTAYFERTLRDNLTQLPRSAIPPGDPHRDSVREEMIKDIEFWNLSSRVLEVYPSVDQKVRGQAKQIVEYRNWVAHGHALTQPAPANILPENVHEQLTLFLVQAGIL